MRYPQPANILRILVTLLVSKLDRSMAVSFDSKLILNILLISVTLLVSKLERSRLVRFQQSLNIELILVTLLVLNLDKSIFTNFKFENIFEESAFNGISFEPLV